MRALYLVVPILGVLAIAYRYYSAFIAARVMALDDTRVTPAHVLNDGQNYHPTHRLVLFGHHFAAIAGAGPLIGPVLAAQLPLLSHWARRSHLEAAFTCPVAATGSAAVGAGSILPADRGRQHSPVAARWCTVGSDRDSAD